MFGLKFENIKVDVSKKTVRWSKGPRVVTPVMIVFFKKAWREKGLKDPFPFKVVNFKLLINDEFYSVKG